MSPARREPAEKPQDQGDGGPERKATQAVCPNCRKPSCTYLYTGKADVYCRKCGVLFQLSIRVVKEA